MHAKIKSYTKLNFSAAAELHTKRKINKEETSLAKGQKSISKMLAKDVKDKKITIGDSKKILNIQFSTKVFIFVRIKMGCDIKILRIWKRKYLIKWCYVKLSNVT